MGVDIIEAGFPVSSPEIFCLFLKLVKCKKRYCLWINKSFKNDIDVAAAALKYAKRPRIHTGIGTSESHMFIINTTTRGYHC
jgi:2-isopropylmalate synthase